MAFVPALIAGLGGLGGLFGNRPQTAQTSGSSSATGTQAGTFGSSGASSSIPTLDPRASGLLDSILANYTKALQGTDLTGYQAGGIQDINKMAGITGQNLEEGAASRGIFGPQVQTALNQNEANRGSQINQFNQGIPLLQNQMLQQTLGLGSNIFSQIPRGTYNEQYGGGFSNENTQQNTTQQGTQTSPGNMLGGMFGSLGSILAGLYGQGAFGPPKPTT